MGIEKGSTEDLLTQTIALVAIYASLRQVATKIEQMCDNVEEGPSVCDPTSTTFLDLQDAFIQK